MASLADVVNASEESVLPCGIRLLLPPGKDRQAILMALSGNKAFSSSDPTSMLEGVNVRDLARSAFSGEHVRMKNITVLYIAPGDWNQDLGYKALLRAGGITVLVPIPSDGSTFEKAVASSYAVLTAEGF